MRSMTENVVKCVLRERNKAMQAFAGIKTEPEEETYVEKTADAKDVAPCVVPRLLTISEIEALDPMDRRPEEQERLARVYSIPTAVKAIVQKRADELRIEVMGLETERDALLNFLEGWT